MSHTNLHLLVPARSGSKGRSVEEFSCWDDSMDSYFDELKTLSLQSGFNPVLHILTIENTKDSIDSLDPEDGIILNLCDGCDVDGLPGPSVEDRCLANVVGCSLAFINNTLTKNGMKEVFKKHGVSTPLGFGAKNSCNLELEINTLSMAYPLFVKVNDSILFFDAGYGSVGIDENSVCHNYKQLKEKCDALWVDFGELTIEEFILGTEFSVLISGGPPYNNESLQVYQPAIRSFNEKIPAHQRFIKYAQNWDDDLCEHKYQKCEESDFSPLVELATNAYISVSGNCFGRVDIRKRENGKFYVLEVNSSCGIGFGSSSDNILLLAGQCTLDFFKAVLCTLPIARAIIGEKQTFRQVNERDLMCVSGDRSSTLKVQ